MNKFPKIKSTWLNKKKTKNQKENPIMYVFSTLPKTWIFVGSDFN